MGVGEGWRNEKRQKYVKIKCFYYSILTINILISNWGEFKHSAILSRIYPNEFEF